jgi:hypothetical protein
MKMIALKTSPKQYLHFNPMNIVNISPAGEFTAMECVAGPRRCDWTIFEPFVQVLKKVNDGLKS